MSNQSELNDLLQLIGQGESGEKVASPPPLEEEADQILSLRYHVQINSGEFHQSEPSWQSLISFETPLEALRGCSEALDLVKESLGLPITVEIDGLSRGLRVWDAEEERPVIWEDGSGRLHWDGEQPFEVGAPDD